MGIQKRDGPEGWHLLSGEFLTTSFLLMVFQTWLGTVFFYRFSSAQARESKSKPEAAVLITTTLCPHSTVRRAWLTEPRGPAVVSTGHQRCAVLWALGFPPCWISQPIALDKVWAYLFINFYIRQWWIQLLYTLLFLIIFILKSL